MIGKYYKRIILAVSMVLILALAASACSSGRIVTELNPVDRNQSVARAAAVQQNEREGSTVSFTLVTDFGSHGMVFIGSGGEFEGVVNPTLRVAEGDTVEITLINGDGMLHDIAFPDFEAYSEGITSKGSTTVLTFTADEAGEFLYLCTIPGHQQAGMEGRLIVGDFEPVEQATASSIVLDPTDLPPPIGERAPQHVTYEIETVELEGQLADGTTFTYWTYDGTVPGPFLRVKEGDTVEIILTNRADSTATHSIDLHAVTGPGGGAAVTQAAPGESKSFTFKAINPGIYVYHCATPMVAHHIANGMYGLILVEPAEGMAPVDREFYVMQGEIYTQGSHGEHGRQEIDIQKLLNETPEYFVFNGAVGGLTEEYVMTANVGETVRIYFGVGGPNFIFSFHVIGEVFDRVYDQGSITSPPLTDVQTTLVAPGGATVVEFGVEVPGRLILVDHALSRAERGLVGFLDVVGEANPEIFHSEEEQSAGGH
jgi:nitrite reductase (NO-forming)